MKRNAQMAELVDAQVSGICAARRGGSSPLLGTIPIFKSPPPHVSYCTRRFERSDDR